MVQCSSPLYFRGGRGIEKYTLAQNYQIQMNYHFCNWIQDLIASPVVYCPSWARKSGSSFCIFLLLALLLLQNLLLLLHNLLLFHALRWLSCLPRHLICLLADLPRPTTPELNIINYSGPDWKNYQPFQAKEKLVWEWVDYVNWRHVIENFHTFLFCPSLVLHFFIYPFPFEPQKGWLCSCDLCRWICSSMIIKRHSLG